FHHHPGVKNMTIRQTQTLLPPTSVTLPKPRIAMVSIAVCALLAGAATLSQAQGPRVTPAPAPAPGNGATRPGGPVTLNFANAEIDAVARTMAVITGRNVVVD